MAAQAATISLSHHEPLQRLNISGASVDGSQKIGATVPVVMSFDALGRSFELQRFMMGKGDRGGLRRHRETQYCPCS